MEDTTDLSQLDQSALQGLLGGGDASSLIPEALVTTITIGFIVLNVLGILFFVFYVISLIRKWKVESAVLQMQKDLAEIKAALSQTSQPAPVVTNAETPVATTHQSNTADKSDEAPTQNENS